MKAPESIGPYEIVDEISRDDLGVLYRAHHTKLNRAFALKVPYPHIAGDVGFSVRFRRETRAVARLRHPNIAAIYEAGEADGQKYIATDILPASNLVNLLETDGVLTLEHMVPLVQQLAEALDYTHAQGVVHCNLNPGCIAVGKTRRGTEMIVSDFGLARMAEGSCYVSDISRTTWPAYLAPEQVDPKRGVEIGPEADRYALGALAFFMLTGQAPYSGEGAEIVQAKLQDDPPLPRSIDPDLVRSLDEVVPKMMARDLDERYSSSRAFADQLRTVMLTESQIVRKENRLEPLYERIQVAAQEEDWSQVLRLGELIQVLDVSYRDVPELMDRARGNLRRES